MAPTEDAAVSAAPTGLHAGQTENVRSFCNVRRYELGGSQLVRVLFVGRVVGSCARTSAAVSVSHDEVWRSTADG